MFLNPALSDALDRIAERASDVRRAYTPGAQPARDDVATGVATSDFTLDPLGVAAGDDAYFVTRDARGGYAYTRDGAFHLENGVLTSASGAPLLGARDGAMEELCVDPVDAALGRASGARVESDGTFAYDRASIDPRTGRSQTQRVVAGRLALARFPAGTRMERSDADAMTPPRGVVAHTGTAGDGTFAPLGTHRRSRSGIDIDESLARLKEAYVAFDALQAAQSIRGHAAKTVMDLLK